MVSGGQHDPGKPRQCVIVQDDAFQAMDSVVICPLTTDLAVAELFRLRVEPNERNGLRIASQIMVDKITTISKGLLAARIGKTDDEQIARLNQSVAVFLGLAVSSRDRSRV